MKSNKLVTARYYSIKEYLEYKLISRYRMDIDYNVPTIVATMGYDCIDSLKRSNIKFFIHPSTFDNDWEILLNVDEMYRGLVGI